MSRRRSRAVSAVARHSIGIALATPEVVAQRVTRMWLAGASPSRRDREEFHRMWAEKVAAFHESWYAMALEMYRTNFKVTMGVFGAGLAPIHRRAAANARRLRRAR